MNNAINLIGAVAALVSAVAALLAAFHARRVNKIANDIKVDTKRIREGLNGGPSQSNTASTTQA